MNILMLGWELPPHNSGGLGIACYHMAKALANHGADIDFVVPYSADHPEIDFMKIHNATKLSPLHRYGLGAYDTKNVIDKTLSTADVNDLKDMRGVQKRYVQFVEHLMTTIDPDVIHVHDWLTMEAGIRAKMLREDVPLIVHVHATEFDRSGSESGNPLVHEIEYQGLIMADRIIAVSQITKNIIVEKYGIPPEKIEVVHNAINVDDYDDVSKYDRGTYKYLQALKDEGYTIVSTMSRLTIQKGLVNFVRAAAKALSKYDKLAFLIAGAGEQRDELIRLSAELGVCDKVIFTDCFVRGKQWRDAFCVSDVFVMSSVSEPFGLTALEAAHHGDAVILTRQSGVGEVLSSVLRYDFWDEDKLADQIVGIASSRALMETLKEDISREYTKISWFDVAKKLLGLYNDMKQGVTV